MNLITLMISSWEQECTFVFEDDVGIASTQFDVLFAGFFISVFIIGWRSWRSAIAAQSQDRYQHGGHQHARNDDTCNDSIAINPIVSSIHSWH